VDDPKLLATLTTILDTLKGMSSADPEGGDTVSKNIVESEGSTFGKKGKKGAVNRDQIKLTTEIAYKHLKKQAKSPNLGRDKPRLVAEYTLFAKTFYKVMQQLKPDEKGKTKVLTPAEKALIDQQKEMNKLLKSIASGKFGKGGPGGGPGGPGGPGGEGGLWDNLLGLLGLGGSGLGLGGMVAQRFMGRKGRQLAKEEKAKKKQQKKDEKARKKQQKKQQPKKQPKPKTPRPGTKPPKPPKVPKPPTKPVTDLAKKGGQRAAAITAAKTGGKIGSRFIPGVGWVLLGIDVAMIGKGLWDVNKAWKEVEEGKLAVDAGHAKLMEKLRADQERAIKEGGDPLGVLVKELQMRQHAMVKAKNDATHKFMTNKGILGLGKKIDKDEQAELDDLDAEIKGFHDNELRPAIRAWQMSKAMRGDEKAQEFVRKAKKEYDRERIEAIKRKPEIDRLLAGGMDMESINEAMGWGGEAKKRLRAAIAQDHALSQGGTNMYSPDYKKANDFMFRGGRFIRFDSQDDILGAKTGGALDKLLMRANPGNKSIGDSRFVRNMKSINSISDQIGASNIYLNALVKLTEQLVKRAGGGGGNMRTPRTVASTPGPGTQGSTAGPSFGDSHLNFYNSAYSMHTPGTMA